MKKKYITFNPNEYSKKFMKEYRMTKRGMLLQRYSAMKRRVAGKGVKSTTYKGLPICTRDEFLNWALNDVEFNKQFDAWVLGGHENRLHPTIDRRDNKKGYVLDNMQWLTLSDHGTKSSFDWVMKRKSKYRGVTYFLKEVKRHYAKGPRPWRACIVKNKKSTAIGSFYTEEEAARAYDRWAKVIYGRAINFPD